MLKVQTPSQPSRISYLPGTAANPSQNHQSAGAGPSATPLTATSKSNGKQRNGAGPSKAPLATTASKPKTTGTNVLAPHPTRKNHPPDPSRLDSVRGSSAATHSPFLAAVPPGPPVTPSFAHSPSTAASAPSGANDTQNGGSTKPPAHQLKFYPILWKRVLEKAKLFFRLYLATENGFPTDEECKRESRKALYNALDWHSERNGRVEDGTCSSI